MWSLDWRETFQKCLLSYKQSQLRSGWWYCKQATKPQANKLCCLWFSFLCLIAFPCNTITFQKYFWSSRFSEFPIKERKGKAMLQWFCLISTKMMMDTLSNRVEKMDSLLKRLKFLFACHAKKPEHLKAPFHKENRNNNGRALCKNVLVITW